MNFHDAYQYSQAVFPFQWTMSFHRMLDETKKCVEDNLCLNCREIEIGEDGCLVCRDCLEKHPGKLVAHGRWRRKL